MQAKHLGDQAEMKVLHVTASMSPEWGGPVPVVAGLTAALARQGVASEIVTPVGVRVGTDPIPTPGVPLHSFETGFPARLWTGWARGLSRFLAEQIHRFDLVHIHEIWHAPHYAAVRAARKQGIPHVVTIHGALDPWRLRQRRLRKWLYLHALQVRLLKQASRVHVLTRAEAETVSRLGVASPVSVIPNGVEPFEPAQPADRVAFLARYPQLAGKRVCLFMSRLHAMKGPDILARSFVTLAAQFPDAVLLAAGPDEDGAGCRAAKVLEQAGLRERVVFPGLLTGADKRAAFACAALFVLPSYSEGFSMAVLEALAAGLPVVISEQCHFPEVAQRGAGYVVPAEASPVAEAMGAVLADAAHRADMGRNGHALVTERYTWPAIAPSVAAWYRALVRKSQDG